MRYLYFDAILELLGSTSSIVGGYRTAMHDVSSRRIKHEVKSVLPLHSALRVPCFLTQGRGNPSKRIASRWVPDIKNQTFPYDCLCAYISCLAGLRGEQKLCLLYWNGKKNGPAVDGDCFNTISDNGSKSTFFLKMLFFYTRSHIKFARILYVGNIIYQPRNVQIKSTA